MNAGQWLRRDTPFRRALFIAVLYALFAGLWISLSDQALVWFIEDSAQMAWAQTAKGGFFVAVSATLLFILVHRAAHGLLRSQRLALDATRDPLTGLPGHAAIPELAKRLMARADAQKEPAALIHLDVDRFARINDAFGIAAGNALLMQMARRLQDHRRVNYTLARSRSDELLVMVGPPCDADQAQALARSFLALLGKPYRLAGELIEVELSAGIAIYPRDGNTAEEIILAAERAKRDATESRDSPIQFYQPAGRAARQHLNIQTALNRALDQNQFRLFLQPLVNLETGHILGAEALLRWQHPTMGQISPGHFIPMLEENGGIHEVGAWVLETAITEMQHWPRIDRSHLKIGVNVSRRQLENHNFQSFAQRRIQQFHGNGEVVLEITESMAMQNPEVIIDRLDALKESGYALAMDDFGTGYSSLSELKRFAFDYIKIDRTFVRGIPDDRSNDLLVHTMCDMTARLGYRAVGEGVETFREAARLRQLGLQCVQGYLFSPPLPAEEFTKLLRQRHVYPVGPEARPPK